MTKPTFPLIASVLIFALLFTVVAHACAAFNSIQAIVQAPCDHDATGNKTRDKRENSDCDSIRYGILSIRASSAEPEFSKLYSAAAVSLVFLNLSLTGSLSSFKRSQAPPLAGVVASPLLSHVVLRI